MYFASRVQAGRMLATQLTPKYRYENCAVVALSDGGVMVGAQIAKQLHCVMMMLLSAEIKLPREPKAVAGITPEGVVSYNHEYSSGELDELLGEYRGIIEQEKLTHMHELNSLLGSGGVIDKSLLKAHNIILVSDGIKDAFTLDLAYEFLKPIKIEKLVVATPLASIAAVDHMHVLADDIYCLSVPAEFMDTDHYYDQHDVPDHKVAIETVENIVLNWE
ncbi:MAG TPA: phosphoribosyltransferase family protein [Candidatus Saccharimonadales bacterium]|nr:phosphoribosyltransferase family protein [Candidatus Saccharimonadales bacterium]